MLSGKNAGTAEALREAFDAALRGSPDQWIRLLNEDVEWDISTYPLPDVPIRGRGRDALLDAWATYMSGWNDYRAEVKDVVAGENDVVITVHEMARMRETDVLLDRDLVYLWTLRDGGISFGRVFRTAREALDAASLTRERP